jgi:hypothetical protein
MKPSDVLEMLEDTAARLGVRVSYEQLATAGLGGNNHGGMCRVKGEVRVIIDKRATTQERVTTLAGALAKLDTSAVQVAPKVRELLDYHGERAIRRAS